MSRQALILVVEDNLSNQLLTSSVLELEGYSVELAGSSVEALERVALRRPDLILMDVQLPGMDGLSLTKILKATRETAVIPIVALTANAMNGDGERALKAGCVGYISKPFDTRTLGDKVRGFLR